MKLTREQGHCFSVFIHDFLDTQRQFSPVFENLILAFLPGKQAILNKVLLEIAQICLNSHC